MNIIMIGAGYVGLVSGACFSSFGYRVICVDKDSAKIEKLNQGKIPIYEPGLDEMVARNLSAGRLSFSTDLAGAMQSAEMVFIAVGTPSRRGDGMADISYVMDAAEEIGPYLRKGMKIVVKSTVPVGTTRKVHDILIRYNADIEVINNPEFLREGSAIEDFMRPDRVIVGTMSARAQKTMKRLYRPLSLSGPSLLITDLETSELIKYATNGYLAMKVTFINEMSDLCEKTGADIGDLAKGIGLDRRIGAKFLHPGPGFGGSCFPKDTRALAAIADEAGTKLQLIKATISANEQRKVAMAQKIIEHLGGSVKGKVLAILGLTFKPNTDDIREAPSLVILPILLKEGAKIKAYDPAGMKEMAKTLPELHYCTDTAEAIRGADALIFLTEWDVFRALDPKEIRALLKGDTIIDLRNIYRPGDIEKVGMRYFGIGQKHHSR